MRGVEARDRIRSWEDGSMKQCPLALSLQICEKVVIEAETRNLTLVNCFTQRVVKSVPPEPLSFIVCSTLIGAIPLNEG